MSRMLPLRASRTRGSSSTGSRRITQTARRSGPGRELGTTKNGNHRQIQAERELIDKVEAALLLNLANRVLGGIKNGTDRHCTTVGATESSV